MSEPGGSGWLASGLDLSEERQEGGLKCMKVAWESWVLEDQLGDVYCAQFVNHLRWGLRLGPCWVPP